jgi:hypothetical protein
MEETFTKKFKNGHENFLPRKAFLLISELHGFWTSKQEVPNYGNLFFQNDDFKLQEVFSDLEIRVFLKNGLGSFKTFLILKISDKPEVLKRFQKLFKELNSKPKKPRILYFS